MYYIHFSLLPPVHMGNCMALAVMEILMLVVDSPLVAYLYWYRIVVRCMADKCSLFELMLHKVMNKAYYMIGMDLDMLMSV